VGEPGARNVPITDDMIALTGVTRQYGRGASATRALDDVSLTLTGGTVWAVVGPNGAGKSTLLSLLLGFIRPSRGRITIGGDLPRDFLRDHGAGYLPERFSLPTAWRTGEAIRMFAGLEGAASADVDRAIELLDLGSHLEKKAADLSRGLLQRLGLAQAILARRALLVLDEPTEGLDPVWRIRFRDIIAELRSEDRTIILASHDLTELERIADHAIVLDNGSVRDVIHIGASGDVDVTYRLRLAEPFDAVASAFPRAATGDPLEYIVQVTGPAELSQRIAGLIAMGGIIAAVEPVRPDLEERVRSALDSSS
jgi:ABC-type multidrug transport system ATPase subunit